MNGQRPAVMRVLCLLCLLAPLPAAGAEADRQKLAEQYFRVSGLDASYGNERAIQQQLLGELQAMEGTLGANLANAQRLQLHQFLQALVPEVMALASDAAQRLRPELVEVLATAYTEEELRALVAFYSSPVGQRVVAKNEGLVSTMMSLVGAHSSVLTRDMQELVLTRIQMASRPAAASGGAAEEK